MTRSPDDKFVAIAITSNVLLDVALFVTLSIVEMKLDLEQWRNPLWWHAAAEGFVVGCLVSQLVALAMWTALFPGSNLRRLLVGTVVFTCTVYSLAALARVLQLQGYYLQAKGDALDIWHTTSVWLLALLVFYLVQIPFWMLRGVLQMRVARQPTEPLSPRNQQVSLMQIFAITAYLAVVFAASRVEGPIPGVRDAGRVALAATALSVGFGVPYLWAILGTRHALLGLAVVLLASEPLVFLGSRVYMVAGTTAIPTDWPYVVVAFRGVQVATLLVGIRTGLAARAAGYRVTASCPRMRQEAART